MWLSGFIDRTSLHIKIHLELRAKLYMRVYCKQFVFDLDNKYKMMKKKAFLLLNNIACVSVFLTYCYNGILLQPGSGFVLLVRWKQEQRRTTRFFQPSPVLNTLRFSKHAKIHTDTRRLKSQDKLKSVASH